MLANGGWDLIQRLKGLSLPGTLRTTGFNSTWRLHSFMCSQNKTAIFALYNINSSVL